MNLKYRTMTSEQRTQKVLDYVRKNLGCDLEEIIAYITNAGYGSRVTTRKAVNQLLESGRLDDGKQKVNSKAYRFTVVEDNPLLTIPRDLHVITTKFEKFVTQIKKLRTEKIEIHYKEDNPSIYERIDKEEIVNTIPYLPYYIISEIDRIYKFNLLVSLPERIHRQSVIRDLYPMYFEYLSKLYLITSRETQAAKSSVTNLSIEETSLFKAYRNSQTNSLNHTAWVCRILDIESNLYDVLDQVWLRNVDVCPFLYSLVWDSKFLTYQRAKEMFAPEYSDLVNNNETLKKIHLKIDYQIFWLEELHWQGYDPDTGEHAYNPF